MRHLEGQTYCCLPWCGASFASPYHSRVFVVDGVKVRLTYPAMIHYHDMVPRSQGGDPDDIENQAPLCHSCHMKHHHEGGMRLTFADGLVTRADGLSGTPRPQIASSDTSGTVSVMDVPAF